MDAHFAEYLAAIQAMQEVYGESAEWVPSDFHQTNEQQLDASGTLVAIGS